MNKKKEYERHSTSLNIRVTETMSKKILRINKKLGGTISQTLRHILERGLSVCGLTESTGESKLSQVALLYYQDFKLMASSCREYCNAFQKKASAQMSEEALTRNVQGVRIALDKINSTLNKIFKEGHIDEPTLEDTATTEVVKEESMPVSQDGESINTRIEANYFEKVTLRGKVVSEVVQTMNGEKRYSVIRICCTRHADGDRDTIYHIYYDPQIDNGELIQKGISVEVEGNLYVQMGAKDGGNILKLIVKGNRVQALSTSEGELADSEKISVRGTICREINKPTDAVGRECTFKLHALRLNKSKTCPIETEYLVHANESMFYSMGVSNGDPISVTGDLVAGLSEDGKTPKLQILATEAKVG